MKLINRFLKKVKKMSRKDMPNKKISMFGSIGFSLSNIDDYFIE